MKNSLVFFLLLSLISCHPNNATPPVKNYTMTRPDAVYELPPVLVEISGIAYLEEDKLACVQDELGLIFSYNIKSGNTDTLLRFSGNGDYEDIAISDAGFWIVESNGTLFNSKKGNTNKYETFLHEENNVEGLCYNAFDNNLLLACKGKPFHKQGKNYKEIYSFNLSTNRLEDKPFLLINKEAIRRPSFSPSALAIHPIDSTIYVISSKGGILVLNREGDVLFYEDLSRIIFRQPEGICFDHKGTMFISDEGEKKGSGNIFKFNYKANE